MGALAEAVKDIEVVRVDASGAGDGGDAGSARGGDNAGYRVVLDAAGGASADRLAAALVDAVPDLRAGAALAVLTDENVAALHLPRVRAALVAAGLLPQVVVMPPGEQHKTLSQVERLSTVLLAAGLDRGGVILSLGGGVVSDVGGFLAAIFLRGIRWAAAPTTLLSQADAAIGGKTGVNLPQGKNLLGAFHPPALVYADLSTLRTLPQREVASGLGEIVKHALLCDDDTLALLEENAAAAAAGDPALLRVLLSASCRLKAKVVTADPLERDVTGSGGRAVLNLGHTVGHALETASQTQGEGAPLRHGEAVALGLLAMARVSARLGMMPAEFEGRLRALLERLGLPTDLDRRLSGAGHDLIATTLGNDKKRAGGLLRYVALRGVGRAEIIPLRAADLADLAGPLQRNHKTDFSAEDVS